MRLNELTGYKSHPLNRAASQLKPKEIETNQISDYKYETDSMNNFIKTAEQHGWKKINTDGYFANIFQHPNYPYVYKVFVDDRGYEKFLKVIRKNQNNPHVPKVRGRPINIGKNSHAIRMELLQELDGENDPILKKYIAPSIEPKRGYSLFDYLDSDENSDYLEEHWPELDFIIGYSGEDWNSSNVMKRGDTLVVTDPWAS